MMILKKKKNISKENPKKTQIKKTKIRWKDFWDKDRSPPLSPLPCPAYAASLPSSVESVSFLSTLLFSVLSLHNVDSTLFPTPRGVIFPTK